MTHTTSLANNLEAHICRSDDSGLMFERSSNLGFVGVAALLFVVSSALTIIWCSSMSAMGEMPMPGGWTMSMTWMRMPGQTWAAAAATFLGMWIVMMVAMMLPSLVPMLWRYRQAVWSKGKTRLSQVFSVDANGQNFFGIEAGDGAVINSVIVQGLGGTNFADINQWRLGGFGGTPVPEPTTMVLLATGLGGIAARLRKRRNGVKTEDN